MKAEKETMIMTVSGRLIDSTNFEGADTVMLLPGGHDGVALSILIVGATGVVSPAITAAGTVPCTVVLSRPIRASRTGH